ncbi:MAG: sulfite reductase, flavoprotein subunit [Sodalis sp. Fle]|nr:MAG: sulfite reductase, flavoprotein subunit [Sodalis sp. Fle]
MAKQVLSNSLLPLNAEQLDCLHAATDNLSALQLAWISGYLWARVSDRQHTGDATVSQPITLLSISQTGNARRLAEQLRDDLIVANLDAVLINGCDYKFKQIAQEKLLLIVTSTHGEGDPPEEGLTLYKYLFSKKAPALKDMHFAVFSLGDSSYEHFAKTGKDFDHRLAELGAKRMHDRVDADVDYQSQADVWRSEMTKLLKARVATDNPTQQQLGVSDNIKKMDSNFYTKDVPFTAHLAVSQKITSRHALKDVYHLEIDLADSGMHYQPGDALGVWYENDPALITELLSLLLMKGDELVQVQGQFLPISEALQKHYELTQNTQSIVKNYAALAHDKGLQELIADKEQLKNFVLSTPIIDMMSRAPVKLRAEQLLNLLRPLTPRLYSIASSQAEVGEEVHITVGVVRYKIDGRLRTGGASGYLAERLSEDDAVRVFIEYNENFRLPSDSNMPVIMIGPGTGIAPFRAFMQQRAADGALGHNWLFFGNLHLTDDFLYQVEWQRYVKEGVLTQIDVAWSRDQENKVYVQDKLQEKGDEVWRWIQRGAYIYVCGANCMALGVEQTLMTLVAEHGGMDFEQASEFLSELRVERRYQRDVY